MKFVIFGLSISSSWGNGHATLWRGLCRALARHGHQIVFFEKDVPYYAANRDLWDLPRCRLELYESWETVLPLARRHLSDADIAIVTSYCPDAVAASDLLLDSNPSLRVFYDLDSPVTLDSVRSGEPVDYIGPRGLRDFDLVLSFAGGRALDELKEKLGAKRVAPLYGSVDPEVHRPAPPTERYRAALSYLGTNSPDRLVGLRALFIEPARRLPEHRFLIGGSKYDGTFPWLSNIFFVNHVAPADHPSFFASSKLTLNVTRRAMALNGYCPSGRLFEAAACGAVVLTDWWEGLDLFFKPDSEILVARTTGDALSALARSSEELAQIGKAARERALDCHTADVRAREMESILESVAASGVSG